MQITRRQLQKIIREEIERSLFEVDSMESRLRSDVETVVRALETAAASKSKLSVDQIYSAVEAAISGKGSPDVMDAARRSLNGSPVGSVISGTMFIKEVSRLPGSLSKSGNVVMLNGRAITSPQGWDKAAMSISSLMAQGNAY